MKPVEARRLIIDRLLEVLRSRRVIIALATLTAAFLIMAVPTLEPVRGEIIVLLVTFGLALIGGYSVEEAARLGRERTATPSDSLRDVIREIILELLDEEREGQQKEMQDV